LDLKEAVIVSLVWGFSLIDIFSYKIAKDRNENPVIAVIEHSTIAIIVLAVIYFTGNLVKNYL
jgi:VIT1/CCC1 family predicted Fe2+/Mn2+ transporter